MEHLSGVTLCSCRTIFQMAPGSRGPCGGDRTAGWNLSLAQSAAGGPGRRVIIGIEPFCRLIA